MITRVAIIVGMVFVTSAGAQSSKLPVPGAHYWRVTQRTIGSTVCVSGWTATVRPPASWAAQTKRHMFEDRPKPLPGTVADYELDHAVSLELGGAPWSTSNLWLEPITDARRDDHGIEASLHKQLCAGQIALRQAQRAEIAYKRANG